MSAHAVVFAQSLVNNSSVIDGINDLKQHIYQEIARSLNHNQLEILIEKAVRELEDQIGKHETLMFLVSILNTKKECENNTNIRVLSCKINGKIII